MTRNEYTVKQVNAYIKNMFTQDFMLNRIYVKGEVSNCKYHTSGHVYFSLKDESGTIACVMFAGQRAGLSFRMSEGQQVVVLGSVNVYERTGSYQLYAKEILQDGEGELYERFQALKKDLEEMGMFAPEYKKDIPPFAKTIGIVTAPTGAAIRDIMNIAERRNPYVQLLLYPAFVQGEGAGESIIRGIRLLEKKQVDVIIIGRGGGSMEDLWAFNEETVARAVFDCQIPVISAVGHETDMTIADYVADLRAPTPSAAAELAVWEYQAWEQQLKEYQRKLNNRCQQHIKIKQMHLKEYQTKLGYLHPQSKVRDQQQRAVEVEERLKRLIIKKRDQSRNRLAILVEQMKGLSPVMKLNQGFSYVVHTEKNEKGIKSIADVKEKDELSMYVTDGIIYTAVTGKKEVSHGGKERKGRN